MRKDITFLILMMVVLLLVGTLTISSISTIRDIALEKMKKVAPENSESADGGQARRAQIPVIYKHAVYLLVGALAFIIMVHFDYHLFARKKVLSVALILMALLLLATFFPPFGGKINGAYRWLTWGPISFQPSELAKFVLVVWLAARLTYHQDKIHRFKQGFLMPFCMAGIFVSIIVVQKDMGIPFVMLVATFTMVWVAGGQKRYLLGSCFLCGIGGIILILLQPYRLIRIWALLNPWGYRESIGFQLIQSLVALSQGGFWGRGPGGGEQKLGYLPAADTDFIFATFGEEFGLFGTSLMVVLFLGILYFALRISANAADLFGSLIGIGISILLLVQAAFIIAVTVGLAPTKGLPLPFVSYGGSALLSSLLMMGVLVNIGIQGDINKSPETRMMSIMPSLASLRFWRA